MDKGAASTGKQGENLNISYQPKPKGLFLLFILTKDKVYATNIVVIRTTSYINFDIIIVFRLFLPLFLNLILRKGL
jgi:hypothetical protein